MVAPNTNSLLRILIVDDDTAWRATLGEILAGEGYAVSHASNGEQAVSLFRRQPFDLVITELNLAGKDGLHIIAEMRREPFRARFIATIRAGWLPADFCRRMAENLGAHCVFAKPVPPEHLLIAVESALG